MKKEIHKIKKIEKSLQPKIEISIESKNKKDKLQSNFNYYLSLVFRELLAFTVVFNLIENVLSNDLISSLPTVFKAPLLVGNFIFSVYMGILVRRGYDINK